MKIFVYLMNGLIGGVIAVKIGEMIFNKKIEIDLFKSIIIMIYSLILALNYLIVDNFLKVIIIFIAHIILNHFLTRERMEKIIVVSFIEYVNILISEILVVTILMILTEVFPMINIETIKNTFLLNVIILSVNYLLARLLINKFKKIVSKTEGNDYILLAIMTLLILICVGSLFYRIEITTWQLNNNFILNAVIIVVTSYIGIITVFQRINYQKVNKQYKNLAKYSEINSSLLEEYSILNHEHENQLIIIKGLIKSSNKELEEYVDMLIKKKSNVKFKWVRELNNINFQGLKSFINYKILEVKAESIKVCIKISRECKNVELGKLSKNDKDKLYSIIGVYLDNARDAALKSDEKIVNIEGYVENEKICFEIANTYTGEVDLEKINDYGYTSKGSGHGTGLYMIHNLIKNDHIFTTETKVQNGYFVQVLKIKIEK